MGFELKVNGINPTDLIEVQGVDGPFYVKMIGSREELYGGSFYGDRSVQFFFYSKPVSTGDGTFIMNVYAATTERLSGPSPNIDKKVLEIVKQNIKIVLTTRDINFPARIPSEKDIPSDVVFSWGID